MSEPIRLHTAEIAVELTPDRGADIRSVVHLPSGTSLLFARASDSAVQAQDSHSRWLAGYRGGWQVLCPNAGDESVVDGAIWGFHGEASVVPWQLSEQDARSVRLRVDLSTAPVSLDRTVSLTGSTLRLDERIANLSPRPIELMWVHHPAFGQPFLEPGCRIEIAGATFVADAEIPGDTTAAGSHGAWPLLARPDGRIVDLGLLPPATQPRSVFGYLSELREGCATITNPRLGLAATLRWPLEVFPYAWVWQELYASDSFPWHRRAYVAAVEPASTIPQGFAAARAAGGRLVALASGETRDAWIELSVGTESGSKSHCR